MKRLVTLYVLSFCVAVTSFSLSLAGLLQPKWIHFQTPRSSPISLATDYGLFQRCDASDWVGDRVTCRRFPTRSQDCKTRFALDFHNTMRDVFAVNNDDRPTQPSKDIIVSPATSSGGNDDDDDDDDVWGFCDSWITAGYFQQLALVLGLASILASFAAILSPLHSRRKPYRLISSLLFLHALALVASTSLIAHEFNTNDRFVFGSRLSSSFIMSTTAWSLDLVIAAALVLVIGLLKVGDEERGYERIDD